MAKHAWSQFQGTFRTTARPYREMRIISSLLLLFLALPLSAATTQPSLDSKCDALLAKWKDRLDEEHFVTLVSPPFILAGDGGQARLESYRDHTVLAAARALHATYFDAQPTEPILIFLFETEAPYKRLAKKWFDDDNVPHFGFCRSDGVMLMNISTGGGTLVHEIVHALIKPDFPTVPTWFNEGLASLYEQCNMDGDRIVGLKNWRLPALKGAIRDGSLRPLDQMIADPDFYGEHMGLNYAQARYLLMYLQEKGQLQQFYRDFRAHVADDPSGIETLRKLVAPKTLPQFEHEWRAWVLAL
jgi:hypothetical protein